jgi:hypothetical protein
MYSGKLNDRFIVAERESTRTATLVASAGLRAAKFAGDILAGLAHPDGSIRRAPVTATGVRNRNTAVSK